MRLDVERLFNEAVTRMGGQVQDHVLMKNSNRPENADYWFPDRNIFAELKCLTHDLMTDRDFHANLSHRYVEWFRRGLVGRPTRADGQVPFDSLPLECRQEVHRFIQEKIERVVNKANKQIKASKAFFEAPTAGALLIIVNDGNFLLQPASALAVIDGIFVNRSKYSNIHYYVYATVNDRIEIGGNSGWLWTHGPTRPEWEGGAREQLARDLSDVIQALIAEKTGVLGQMVDFEPSEEEIKAMTMVKHEHPDA